MMSLELVCGDIHGILQVYGGRPVCAAVGAHAGGGPVQADPVLAESTGFDFSPDPSEHAFTFSVEPVSGYTITVCHPSPTAKSEAPACNTRQPIFTLLFCPECECRFLTVC